MATVFHLRLLWSRLIMIKWKPQKNKTLWNKSRLQFSWKQFYQLRQCNISQESQPTINRNSNLSILCDDFSSRSGSSISTSIAIQLLECLRSLNTTAKQRKPLTCSYLSSTCCAIGSGFGSSFGGSVFVFGVYCIFRKSGGL